MGIFPDIAIFKTKKKVIESAGTSKKNWLT